MKLFYTKGACSLVDRIIINEIGIVCEYESVDLKTKKTEHGVDFFTINPKGAIPTLQINAEEYLTENAVILQYLADTYQATELLPHLNNFERYKVLEWLNYMGTEIHKSFGVFFNPSIPEEMKEKTFVPLLKKKFNFIEKHLVNNVYLLGDNFTLPDAYLFVMLSWAYKFKIDLTECTELARYYQALQQRPSIKQSLMDEG